mmetsp:Transcript_130689/g.317412  ORF Transcript_130689/g.317412 Transcript_130689/m.317412 type:complete len:137 (-) Transcript_130689:258-668(-)
MALSSAAACCQCPPFSQAMIPALQLIASHGWHGAEERQGQLPLHAFSQALMAALILSSIKAQCHWPVFSQALMATLKLTASGTARAAGMAPSNSKAHRHWLPFSQVLMAALKLTAWRPLSQALMAELQMASPSHTH